MTVLDPLFIFSRIIVQLSYAESGSARQFLFASQVCCNISSRKPFQIVNLARESLLQRMCVFSLFNFWQDWVSQVNHPLSSWVCLRNNNFIVLIWFYYHTTLAFVCFIIHYHEGLSSCFLLKPNLSLFTCSMCWLLYIHVLHVYSVTML